MMGLIDHPLTPLIVAWLEARISVTAYHTPESWHALVVARDRLNAALEQTK